MNIKETLKKILGINKTDEESVYDKLSNICEPFPYNAILSEQKLTVEYYHKSGLSLIRDESTEMRYIAMIKFNIKNYKVLRCNKDTAYHTDKSTQYKVGDLAVDIDFRININRVSKSVPIIQSRYDVECVYKDYLNSIKRLEA